MMSSQGDRVFLNYSQVIITLELSLLLLLIYSIIGVLFFLTFNLSCLFIGNTIVLEYVRMTSVVPRLNLSSLNLKMKSLFTRSTR